MHVHAHLFNLHFVCCHLDWNYWKKGSKNNLLPSPVGEWTVYGCAATVQSLGSRSSSEAADLPYLFLEGGSPEHSFSVEERVLVHILLCLVRVSSG